MSRTHKYRTMIHHKLRPCLQPSRKLVGTWLFEKGKPDPRELVSQVNQFGGHSRSFNVPTAERIGHFCTVTWPRPSEHAIRVEFGNEPVEFMPNARPMVLGTTVVCEQSDDQTGYAGGIPVNQLAREAAVHTLVARERSSSDLATTELWLPVPGMRVRPRVLNAAAEDTVQ